MTAVRPIPSASDKPLQGQWRETTAFRFFMVTVRAGFGLLLCFLVALACAKMFGNSPFRQYVPIGFAVVLVLVAARFGVLVSVLGAGVAAIVFAYSLYPPLGSLQVTDWSARKNLSWMLLCALVISFLLFPPAKITRR